MKLCKFAYCEHEKENARLVMTRTLLGAILFQEKCDVILKKKKKKRLYIHTTRELQKWPCTKKTLAVLVKHDVQQGMVCSLLDQLSYKAHQ